MRHTNRELAYDIHNSIWGSDAEAAVQSPMVTALICIVIAGIMLPVQLLELGEEIGWRGYLLGFQIEKYGPLRFSKP